MKEGNTLNPTVGILKSQLFLHNSTEIIGDGNGFQNGTRTFKM